MMALTDQKLYPEKAQLTAGELAAEARRRSAERENNRAGTCLQFGGPSTIRYEEMQEVFHRAYRMKVSDALELASGSIELLGALIAYQMRILISAASGSERASR